MKKLNYNDISIKFKSGLKSAIDTVVTKARAWVGEPHYTTDTDELYAKNTSGNMVRLNKAKYSDYALTQTGNLPTTWTKLNFSGATLINESQDLFDATNSRILKMDLDDVGQVAISMELDTTSGSNHWAELQLRAYDDTDTLIFSKRGCTTSLPKNNADEVLHEILEFYFGTGVEYFEIWIRASSAIPYTDPAITIIKL